MRRRDVVILLFLSAGSLVPFAACNGGGATARAPSPDARAEESGTSAGPAVQDAAPGDALASATCPILFTGEQEFDAAGCASPWVAFDAGPLCTVPCGSLSENATGECTVPCTATACCAGDYAIPVYLSNTLVVCARWGTFVDAGCGMTECSECGGYTCPGNYLCSADCYCNGNDGLVGRSGELPPDPLCIAAYLSLDGGDEDSGCVGEKSGPGGGAGGCTRCRQ
jgi:hypothetical protein